MKIAALGDLHMQHSFIGFYRPIFESISKEADVLILCGDLTLNGSEAEANLFLEEISSCTVRVLGVLGNHEYTKNHQDRIKKILSPKIHFLDEEPEVIDDTGFAGVKGFLGGFDDKMLSTRGEELLRNVVQESVNESIKLEEHLSQLDTEKKVVVLHYSPIKETLQGEPLELYPFLGSTRLLGPIERFKVNCVLHGHAHHGITEGKTPTGIPVYNVAYAVRKKADEDKPYLIVEV